MTPAAKIKAIALAVATAAGFTEAEMFGRARRPAWARHLAMWLASKRTGATSVEIGKVFGRDHTTVLYGLDKAELLLRDGTATEETSGVLALCLPLLGSASQAIARMQQRDALTEGRRSVRERIRAAARELDEQREARASRRAARRRAYLALLEREGHRVTSVPFFEESGGPKRQRRGYLAKQNHRMVEALASAAAAEAGGDHVS